MTDQLPDPLTPPDCDLRAFRDMPLDVQRLRDSDLMLESPEAILAALHLWMAAWHQVPAASLPDDDRSLARYAGYGRSTRAWEEVRDAALRGWIVCADGRLYHPVLAQKANSAWRKRLEHEFVRARDRHRKAEKDLPPDERSEFPDLERWIASRTGAHAPGGNGYANGARPAQNRQGRLPLESRGNSGGTKSAPRAPASKARAHTGAQTVPEALSVGNAPPFRGKDAAIPTENGLKGREGKGYESNSTDPTVRDQEPGELIDRPSGRVDDELTDQEPAPGRLADADLKELFDEVCEASGFRPQSPARIDSSLKLVEEWRDRGLDFDLVVLPAIRHVVSHRSDPVKGLWAFRDRVNHEAARLKAQPAGRAYQPPVSPVLEPPDEDERFRPLRAQLLERLGPATYAALANGVRFNHMTDVPDHRSPVLEVKATDGRSGRAPIIESVHSSVLRNLATAHGYKEVW